MLDTTEQSVTSALKRARPAWNASGPAGDRPSTAACGWLARGGRDHREVHQRVRESADVGTLVALLTDDVLHVDAADAARVPGRTPLPASSPPL